MNATERLRYLYLNHPKKLLALPVLLVIISLFILINNVITSGDIFNKDVSLKGGIIATVSTSEPVDIKDLEAKLVSLYRDASVKRLAEFGSDKQIGIIVEVPEVDEDSLKNMLESYLNLKLTDNNFSLEMTGSSVGEAFYQQMIRAMILSFLFMAIVIFITFRTFVPGIAAVMSALFDIIVTMAFVVVIDLRISPAGIAAFLMLIGYSIDTDILQTSRVLKKREATPVEGVISSVKTGLTMTGTSILAVLLGYIFSPSPVFKEMFLIIFVGLFIDIIMTYMMNAPILITYMNKKLNILKQDV